MTSSADERSFGVLDEEALRNGLTAAGFQLTELRGTSTFIPVSTAWMATTCLPGEGGRCDFTFALDDPELVDHLNDAWIRAAVEYGLLDENRTFLLSISLGVANDPDPPFWATVSVGKKFDIAGVGAELGIFGSGRGMVEFVTASMSGRVVILGTLWQDTAGILVLTEAHRSERLRSFTQQMLDRGVLDATGRRSAELWLGLD